MAVVLQLQILPFAGGCVRRVAGLESCYTALCPSAQEGSSTGCPPTQAGRMLAHSRHTRCRALRSLCSAG